MPSNDNLGLMLEAEKRGILPAEKQPLLAEARRRGLVPGGASTGPKEYQGQPAGHPPNEPGLEERVPFTDPANVELEALGNKAREATAGSSLPVRMAGKAAGFAADVARGTVAPSAPAEVGAMVGSPALAEVAETGMKIAKPVLKGIGNFTAETVGRLIGRDPEAVKELFKNPAILLKSKDAIGQWEQSRVVDAIQDSLQAAGQRFEKVQDHFANFVKDPRGASAPKVDLGRVFKGATEEMKAAGHRLPKALGGGGPQIPRLDPASPEYKAIVQRLAKYEKLQFTDFGSALNERRQLDRLIDYGVEGSQGVQRVSSEGQRVLKGLRAKISDAIRESLPASKRKSWDTANASYAQARQALDQLRKEVVGPTPAATASRVLRELRAGRAESSVVGRARLIGSKAARELQDLQDRLVSSQFRDWVGNRYGTGAGAAIGAHFGGIVGGAAGAAATSPRVMGALTAATGLGAEGASRVYAKLLSQPNVLASTLQKTMMREEQRKREEAAAR